MTRKLLLLVGVLVLTTWASSANALGNCNCTFCFSGSTARCLCDGGIMSCADYRVAYC